MPLSCWVWAPEVPPGPLAGLVRHGQGICTLENSRYPSQLGGLVCKGVRWAMVWIYTGGVMVWIYTHVHQAFLRELLRCLHYSDEINTKRQIQTLRYNVFNVLTQLTFFTMFHFILL